MKSVFLCTVTLLVCFVHTLTAQTLTTSGVQCSGANCLIPVTCSTSCPTTAACSCLARGTCACVPGQLGADCSVSAPNCTIELNAYGFDDLAQASWVKINGVRLFYSVWTDARRGVYTFELDPSTCALSADKSFDTFGNPTAAANLATYIKGLRAGTLLLAVTVDEPQVLLTPAVATLTNLGLNFTAWGNSAWRSKFAFVSQIGIPSKTVWSVVGAGGSNARVDAVVRGPAYSSTATITRV